MSGTEDQAYIVVSKYDYYRVINSFKLLKNSDNNFQKTD